MRRRTRNWLIGLVVAIVVAAALFVKIAFYPERASLSVAEGTGPSPILPAPNRTLIPTVNFAPAVGWPNGGRPVAAPGLAVAAFAIGLDHPRWLYQLPNGDLLVAESNAPPRPQAPAGIRGRVERLIMGGAGAGSASPNRIILLRDSDGDGTADVRSVFLRNLRSPFGMALIGDRLYVANADSLMRFPYRAGETSIAAPGVRVATLPAGINHHWTKNILASPDGTRLYITVGSNSNVGENGLEIERNRAAIWELDLRNGHLRPFATGLRNPNGLAWEPHTGQLWTVVNERDEIGSDLVPDYATSVRDGAFYGWPYSYYGRHVDARVQPQRPDLVARAIAPDYALGPHTASLGIAFSYDSSLPETWRSGLFVGQHGSWNRRPKSGYKVIYVPFANGRPSGPPVDVLTGFLDAREQAQGRPVGVLVDRSGALLVADDVGNVIWRVTGARR